MEKFYSQHGEDRWIVEHLALPEKGVFVEVGAAGGIADSNTYYLEQHGWTGLVVEPNPDVLNELRRCRTCSVAACAVGSDPSRRFFIHPISTWSGFDRGGREILVTTRRLDELLNENRISQIDLLSLDTEGSELDVWSTFDHDIWRPRIVIIEWDTAPLPSKERPIMDFFYRLPYRMVHRSAGNLIFERLSDARCWGK
jgi:FkbM family methyltransferase